MTYDHPPCCQACAGKGADLSGPCAECYGTGHPHPEDTAATNDRETLDGPTALREFANVVCDRNRDHGLSDGARHFGRIYGDLARSRAEDLAATQRPDDREATPLPVCPECGNSDPDACSRCIRDAQGDGREATLRVLALCDEADEAAAADVTEYESRHPGNFAAALVTTTSVRAALAAADGSPS